MNEEITEENMNPKNTTQNNTRFVHPIHNKVHKLHNTVVHPI